MNGKAEYAIEDLSQDQALEFYTNQRLENMDMASNAAYDAKEGLIYFQCTQMNSDDDGMSLWE